MLFGVLFKNSFWLIRIKFFFFFFFFCTLENYITSRGGDLYLLPLRGSRLTVLLCVYVD